MPTMHGPYARQCVNGRLKFWFAVTDGGEVRRYEVLFEQSNMTGKSRARPTFDKTGPHTSNFSDYALPDDLTPYPSAPMRKGVKIADAARAMLTGEHGVDLVRLALTGQLPRTPKFVGDTP